MLDCIYAHLLLQVGLRDLDKYLHISYLYIENFYYNLVECWAYKITIATETKKIAISFY